MVNVKVRQCPVLQDVTTTNIFVVVRTIPFDGASGAAALVGVALCCPSGPAPSSAEAHFLRGWRDL